MTPDIFSDRDRAMGLLHLLVVDFRDLPEAERFCDRFEGEPELLISEEFLREQLWDFELTDKELFSYSLFLQANLKEKYLPILLQEQYS